MSEEMIDGVELDVVIATKLMGWKRMSWKDYHAQRKYRGVETREELTYSWHDQAGQMVANAEFIHDYDQPEGAWSPSTDLAAAWQVVARLDERNERLTLYGPFAFTDEGLSDRRPDWLAEFIEDVDGHAGRVRRGYGETAPLAICRAALADQK